MRHPATRVPKHRTLFPAVLSLSVLLLTLSVVTGCIRTIRGSNQPCDQRCWTELRESAVKNKQKLARLLL